MRVEIKSGALVHRHWATLPDADLIGAFNEARAAHNYADNAALHGISDVDIRITVTDLSDGTQRVYVYPRAVAKGE